MCRARTIENTYDFKGILSSTYTTCILVKQTWKSIILELLIKIACGHMVSAMMVVEQVGVRIIEEYFATEASKVTPRYGFRKGPTLFGDKGYRAAKNEL